MAAAAYDEGQRTLAATNSRLGAVRKRSADPTGPMEDTLPRARGPQTDPESAGRALHPLIARDLPGIGRRRTVRDLSDLDDVFTGSEIVVEIEYVVELAI